MIATDALPLWLCCPLHARSSVQAGRHQGARPANPYLEQASRGDKSGKDTLSNTAAPAGALCTRGRVPSCAVQTASVMGQAEKIAVVVLYPTSEPPLFITFFPPFPPRSHLLPVNLPCAADLYRGVSLVIHPGPERRREELSFVLLFLCPPRLSPPGC